ncbi:uncharacterized protein [Argopecten irradians]|uniref:uncharacterized protein isoform X2 n=1 Tax=Argopecten irradians TaxID=31199 RepID=UPI0037221828
MAAKRETKSEDDNVRREEQEIILNADSNINPVGAERVTQLMESLISSAVPGQTESCTPSENTGAIAIPEISSGAVANPTTVNQFTINYNDLREYKDEINIKTMKVGHAENLSIGEQTVLPPGGPPVGELVQQPAQVTPKVSFTGEK